MQKENKYDICSTMYKSNVCTLQCNERKDNDSHNNQQF